MEIPIQNIYYLLCYSWNKLEEKDIVDVDATSCNNVLDLFAHVLINGCNHLFKRGLDRSYVLHSESIKGIKGKVNFDASLKQNLFQKGEANCAYDELDYDVLHNQILKSTIGQLLKINGVDKGLKKKLRILHRKFYGISSIKITSLDFNRAVLHRNNFFYDFLLKICKIIHDNILITEQDGKYKFKNFIKDEVKMRAVFEKFAFNFYHKETTYKPKSEYIDWNAYAHEGSSIERLPKMKTDISLESPERKIIIDTKYYVNALTSRYENEKIRSNHLYQMFAYLMNVKARDGINDKCMGILLYPTVTLELDEHYQFGDHEIRIKTVNLNQHWEDIRLRLLDILN